MKNYIKSDRQLHYISQILAKTNRTFVQDKPDDSHTNLYYDDLGNRIVGRWIDTENGKIMLILNLSSLQYEWLNDSYQRIASFETIGKTILEVEQDIEKHLPELGLNPDGFTDKLHYEIPDYPFIGAAIQPITEQHMNEWKFFRKLANELVTILLGHLQIEGEIRIWPHHFDTGIYVVTGNGMGIGFGLAMSDELVGGPYFYMSGYPSNGSLEYNDVPSLLKGKWEISEHWQGAVLPLSELKLLPEEDYKKIINDYLLKAVHWFVSQR